MICSLMLDLDDAPDFIGGTATALGRPIAVYPYIALRAAGLVRRHYLVTNAQPIKAVGLQNGAVIMDPPADHSFEAFLQSGFAFIADDLASEKAKPELIVVFRANAPMVGEAALIEGLEALRARPELDGAVTVSPRPRFNPHSARRLRADGLLEPYVAGPAEMSAEPFYPDYGAMILRPRCIEEKAGAPPLPWLGKNVLPLKQNAGGPVDYHWQLGGAEHWLKKQGYSDLSASFELQPQPKLQPKPDRR